MLHGRVEPVGSSGEAGQGGTAAEHDAAGFVQRLDGAADLRPELAHERHGVLGDDDDGMAALAHCRCGFQADEAVADDHHAGAGWRGGKDRRGVRAIAQRVDARQPGTRDRQPAGGAAWRRHGGGVTDLGAIGELGAAGGLVDSG